MGFMDELKKLARPYPGDEDDFDEYEDDLDELEDEDEQEDEYRAPARQERPASVRPAPAAPAGPAAPAAPAAPVAAPAMPAAAARPVAAPANVVNLHGASNLQVILVKPDRYEEVSDVAKHLRNKCAVVLNLESTDKDTSRRVVDFLSGCTYALDGNIKKVATSTYIIVPYNVDIVGDLMEELENSGMYF